MLLFSSLVKTLLFLSWKDFRSPDGGGAEIFTHETLKRLPSDKYRIIHFSPALPNAPKEEIIENITYLRLGNKMSVIWHAIQFYNRNRDRIDLLVDQCNTHRFFSPLWAPHHKRVFFIHQLTREIWFQNAKFPLAHVGYITENAMLRLYANTRTLTVSDSTKNDLLSMGFNPSQVVILPEGLNFKAKNPEQLPSKEPKTFLYVGRFVPYKGIMDLLRAFVIVRKRHPDAKLWLIGRGDAKYWEGILKPLLQKNNLTWGNKVDTDVVLWGFVSDEKKLDLMSRATALVYPSIREGWGLSVTEAGAVGTPSIVYPSPGLIDAVNYGKAGWICRTPGVHALADQILACLENPQEYETMRKKAYDFSCQFSWDKTSTTLESTLKQWLHTTQ